MSKRRKGLILTLLWVSLALWTLALIGVITLNTNHQILGVVSLLYTILYPLVSVCWVICRMSNINFVGY